MLPLQKHHAVILLIFILTVTGCTSGSTNSQQAHDFTVDTFEVQHDKMHSISIYDDLLYFATNKHSRDLDTIIAFNPKRLTEHTVFTSKHIPDSTINDVMVNDRWITWVDSDSSGHGAVIYAKNKQSGDVKEISG